MAAWTREEWHQWLDEQLDKTEAQGKLFNAFQPDTVDIRIKNIGRGLKRRQSHVLGLGVNLDSTNFLPQYQNSKLPVVRSGAVIIVAVPKDTLVEFADLGEAN